MVPGNAAYITVLDLNASTSIIRINGEMVDTDAAKFGDKINSSKHVIVEFNSEGGLTYTGIAIGDLIRKYHYETLVKAGDYCVSACALAWLAGSPHWIEENAAVGFHAARLGRDSTTPDGAGNAVVGAYLSGLGFSYETIAFLEKANPTDMHYLTYQENQTYHIDAQTGSPETQTTVAERTQAPAPAVVAPAPAPAFPAPDPVAPAMPAMTPIAVGEKADWGAMGQWIQAASRSTYDAAVALAASIQSQRPDQNVSVFLSDTGQWFVVALGPYAEAQGVLNALVMKGNIPKDSIVRTGNHFDKFVWGNNKLWINVARDVPTT
jgi:hypothetical protein